MGNGTERGHVFKLDPQRFEGSAVVAGLLDGRDADSGTRIELEYAYSRGKKIFRLLTGLRAHRSADYERHRPNLMVWGVCEQGKALFRDFGCLAEAFTENVRQAGLSSQSEGQCCPPPA